MLRPLCVFLSLYLSIVLYPLALPATAILDIDLSPNQRVTISWTNDIPGLVLEEADAITSPVLWRRSTTVPLQQGTQFSATIPISGTKRFYRLAISAVGGKILETSPADGESGVAVTRESIIRFSSPLAENSILSRDDFHADVGPRRDFVRPKNGDFVLSGKSPGQFTSRSDIERGQAAGFLECSY
jgi:hypothetical protein